MSQAKLLGVLAYCTKGMLFESNVAAQFNLQLVRTGPEYDANRCIYRRHGLEFERTKQQGRDCFIVRFGGQEQHVIPIARHDSQVALRKLRRILQKFTS